MDYLSSFTEGAISRLYFVMTSLSNLLMPNYPKEALEVLRPTLSDNSGMRPDF
jgi:hypothetical protein